MSFSFFRLSFHKDKDSSEKADDNQADFETYLEEHTRLEKRILESEIIWENRTFQIAAGGLSLTFTVFSFLHNGPSCFRFGWQIGVIWGVFVFCMLLNYASHRYAVHLLRNVQEDLRLLREAKVPYQEDYISKRFSKKGRLMKWINEIVSVLLILDVLFALIFTYIILK